MRYHENLIGIISDTHGHKANTGTALQYFHQNGIATIVHCGDLGSIGLLELFKGFITYYAIGNTDLNAEELRRKVKELNSLNRVGYHLEFTLLGKTILATHQANHLNPPMNQSHPDFILHGHTHRPSFERNSETIVINPGTAGGSERAGIHSFCVLDALTHQVSFYNLPDCRSLII